MPPSCQRSLPLRKHPSGIAPTHVIKLEISNISTGWVGSFEKILKIKYCRLKPSTKKACFIPAVLSSNMLSARPTIPSKSYCPIQKFQVVGFALTTGPERSCCPTLTQSLAECITLGCLGLERLRYFEVSTLALMLFLGTLGFSVLLVQCRICKWYLPQSYFFEGKIQTHERMMQRACRNVTMSPHCTKCPNWHMLHHQLEEWSQARQTFVC